MSDLLLLLHFPFTRSLPIPPCLLPLLATSLSCSLPIPVGNSSPTSSESDSSQVPSYRDLQRLNGREHFTVSLTVIAYRSRLLLRTGVGTVNLCGSATEWGLIRPSPPRVRVQNCNGANRTEGDDSPNN